MFINDKYPKPATADGPWQTEADWCCISTLVRRGASIGSKATILCCTTIGQEAVVGAGSVVAHDIPDGVIIAGNPARVLRRLDP